MDSVDGRVPAEPGSQATPEAVPSSPNGFDPSRIMEMFCAIANARYALEYWDREVRWACGGNGELPKWAYGPSERGKRECGALRDSEAYLRRFIKSDSDGTGEAGQTAEQAGPEATARAESIAKPQDSTP
jgi:hypothetical protein